MRTYIGHLVTIAAVTLLAALTVGATTAAAHGGRGGPSGHAAPKGASASALVTEAAKQLGVSRATLVAAIEKAAVARVDAAVADGDLDADDAADLKEEAADNLRLAMHLSQTRAVAANLGITTAKLNTEFRDARRALYLARIDQAVEDGDLDESEAAELKEELEDADLPGYKSFGGRGFGTGPGGRR